MEDPARVGGGHFGRRNSVGVAAYWDNGHRRSDRCDPDGGDQPIAGFPSTISPDIRRGIPADCGFAPYLDGVRDHGYSVAPQGRAQPPADRDISDG